MTLASIVAGIVSFWEETTGAQLILAYPSDWRPDLLYAEWLSAPVNRPGTAYYYPGRKPKPKELNSGFSDSRELVGQLQEMLRTPEQTHGVTIDHVLVRRDEGRVSVLFHVPGPRVRKNEWAPIAAAVIEAPKFTTEKGVV